MCGKYLSPASESGRFLEMGYEKFLLLPPPPPTESGRLLEITENFCYHPLPPTESGRLLEITENVCYYPPPQSVVVPLLDYPLRIRPWTVFKKWNIRTVYNGSQHYINDASIYVHRCRMHGRLSEKHGLGASCYKLWETKQVYTRITLKSKYVTIHGVNRFNSLKVKLRNSVSSGITI